MTIKTKDPEVKIAQNLQARNKQVEKSYKLIIEGLKPLLKVFESRKYRTYILVDHSKSGRDTNLLNEFVCFFFNLTLSMNQAGYKMIYFSYDELSLARFGPRIYNRALRQLFKHTMFEATSINVEDCIRVSNHMNVQGFFINRLANGESNHISIDVEEPLTT
ncbi:MAG TPA: hypothetical protein VGD31_08115 [Sphingobacteriaceae bacterium]